MWKEALAANSVLYFSVAAPLEIATYLVFRFRWAYRGWHVYDALAALLPVAIYTLVEENKIIVAPKSLSNLIEPVIVAVGCSLVFLVRSHLGKKDAERSRQYSAWAMVLACLIPLLVFSFVPAFPE